MANVPNSRTQVTPNRPSLTESYFFEQRCCYGWAF
jgi:hypothetical protein